MEDELIFGGGDEALEWGLELLHQGGGKNKGGKGIFAMVFWRDSDKNFIRGEISSGSLRGKEL